MDNKLCFQMLLAFAALACFQAETCKDATNKLQCRYWKKHGACFSHAKRMQRNCAETCQMCDDVKICSTIKCTAPKYCKLDEQTQKPMCACPSTCRHKYYKSKIGSVCGTDGKTYKSICHLEQSACSEEKTIQVSHFGKCKTAECKDSQPLKLCEGWKGAGACKAYPVMMEKYCAKTCEHCRDRAQAQPACQNNSMGCCWDLKTEATGPNGQGCPVCKDKLRMCKSFRGDCNSKSPRNKTFMKAQCQKTCNYCSA